MPQKRPLPGYRFIFNAFGFILIVLACLMIYEMITDKGGTATEGRESGGWFIIALTIVWLCVGSTFIWYARILATADLTTKHWKLGWILIPLGIVTGYGIIFLFMALIWGDDDVKRNFRRPPPET